MRFTPPMRRPTGLGSMIAVLLTCLVAGLAAATGAVLIVAILASAAVGITLLLNPRMHIVFAMYFALVVTGVLEFFFFFGQANWLSSLVVAAMLVTAFLHAVAPMPQRRVGTSLPVLVTLYLVTLLASSLINRVPTLQAIAGLRNYLPYIGVAAMLIYADFDNRFLARLPLYLIPVALLQTPAALVQLLVVGRWRAHQLGAVGRGDEAIAGTFGGSALTGSYTGEMASFLVMAIVLVVALARDKRLGVGLTTLLCLVLMVPILVAETKIALVMLPLLLMVCFVSDIKKNPRVMLGVVFGGAVLFSLIGVTYYIRYWGDSAVAGQQLGYSFDPNFMVTPQHRGRVGTVIHWFDSNPGQGDFVGTLIGHGMASTLEGSVTIGFGSAVLKYGLGLDSHAMSRLLWDGGVISFLLFMAIGLRSFLISWRMFRRPDTPLEFRAPLTFTTAASLAMVLMLPYQVSSLGGSAMQFLFWFVIGYSEVVYRRLTARRSAAPFPR